MKVFKKITATILIFSLIIPTFAFRASALSEDSITAPAAVIMEPVTKTVIFEKNAHEVRPCASITKVMTLLLVMEALDSGKIALTDIVTASKHASSMGGSDIWLEEGEKMSVDDMIKATVVASANDAAVALAEYISGSEDSFVEQMNNKAKTLGMKETVFKNCNGLDEDGHVTTAYDVAVMSCELIKYKKIFDYTGIWMDTLRDGKTQIVNTNKLLKTYNGITGLKTGTTSQAGSCITASAQRDGLSLIAVVLGCKTSADRFKDAASLLDYGFADYTLVSPKKPDELLDYVSLANGMNPTVRVECNIDTGFLCEKSGASAIKSTVEYNKDIKAPIKAGDQIGIVIYSLNGNKLGEFPVTALEDVEEINFFSVFKLLLNSLFAY